jgi:hypothetical protein
MSCEAVPAPYEGRAGMRRHLNGSHASLPCSGAAESFVSFIPLFGRPPHSQDVRASQPGACQILRPIHATLISLATLEGAARRSR